MQSTDAERILTERYPDLFSQAGSTPYLLAHVAVGRVAADLRAMELGTPVRPVTQQELDAATVLSRDLDDAAAYARYQIMAHQRGRDTSWSRIADLYGDNTPQQTQGRFSRYRTRLGITAQELPTAPTLAAYTQRAEHLVQAATADRPISVHLARRAADVLGALLLAATYGQATGAQLRTWAQETTFATAVDGLAEAPREHASAAAAILADAAADLPGTRGDINAVVLTALDVYDPPAAPASED